MGYGSFTSSSVPCDNQISKLDVFLILLATNSVVVEIKHMKWRCQQRSFAMKYSLPHGQCKDGFYCIGGRERLQVYCSRIMGYSATDEVQDHGEGSGHILQRHS